MFTNTIDGIGRKVQRREALLAEFIGLTDYDGRSVPLETEYFEYADYARAQAARPRRPAFLVTVCLILFVILCAESSRPRLISNHHNLRNYATGLPKPST